ncbi:hypothetical protein CVU76_01465 [Candidatus Dojkabacteria bacterium HGW-Dojkabacteria-1]|uniref:AbiV family abortive infection protein n=1 Tax=Candidatus Dojkabacteria bacterium HGW-Dojkabacteria-1 TaxID=2013761 RepID=A0A2N2F3C9_9BACT|nr:MAG: hypothetical protein CVU76_01465 [Candidatus Dojkabacteria bacterium HGW-Dojkabacteria-1]
MRQYRSVIVDTIKKTDSVFDEIGRNYEKTPKNILIHSLSYNSFHITGAILLLCEKNFTQEAAILLRSLIENTVNLKWILNKNFETRIKEYLVDISKDDFGFGKRWTKSNLGERMLEVGFSKEYYNKVVKITHSFSHVNAESLDWTNLKKDYPLLSEDAILSVNYQMLGHTLEVLNNNVSSKFSFYKEIFKSFE